MQHMTQKHLGAAVAGCVANHTRLLNKMVCGDCGFLRTGTQAMCRKCQKTTISLGPRAGNKILAFEGSDVVVATLKPNHEVLAAGGWGRRSGRGQRNAGPGKRQCV